MTIADILKTCEVKDKLTDDNNNFWTVKDKYYEDNELVIIAIPDNDNTKDYELWSVGLEKDVSMDGLRKI